MSDCIWVCKPEFGKRVSFGFFPDYNGGTDRTVEGEKTWEIIRRIAAGECIPTSEMPDKFFHSNAATFTKKIPDYFEVQHFFFKDPIADIFGAFDMGDGYFHPVRLFQWDRVTPIEDEVQVLCIGNAKDTVIHDRTKGLRHSYRDVYDLPLMPKDEQIVTHASAQIGPDVWCDPRIGGAYFFLSSRLADALISAGHKKLLGLVPTKTS